MVVAERFDGTADLSCDAGPPRFVMCRLTAGDAAVWDAPRPAGRPRERVGPRVLRPREDARQPALI